MCKKNIAAYSRRILPHRVGTTLLFTDLSMSVIAICLDTAWICRVLRLTRACI